MHVGQVRPAADRESLTSDRNGTQMAQPVRTTAAPAWRRRYRLGRWARPIQGDTASLASAREGARQTLSAGRPLLHRHREAITTQLGPIAADRPKDRVEADAGQERCATMHLEVGGPGTAWRGRQVTQW
jgi:hypothetical protein